MFSEIISTKLIKIVSILNCGSHFELISFSLNLKFISDEQSVYVLAFTFFQSFFQSILLFTYLPIEKGLKIQIARATVHLLLYPKFFLSKVITQSFRIKTFAHWAFYMYSSKQTMQENKWYSTRYNSF